MALNVRVSSRLVVWCVRGPGCPPPGVPKLWNESKRAQMTPACNRASPPQSLPPRVNWGGDRVRSPGLETGGLDSSFDPARESGKKTAWTLNFRFLICKIILFIFQGFGDKWDWTQGIWKCRRILTRWRVRISLSLLFVPGLRDNIPLWLVFPGTDKRTSHANVILAAPLPSQGSPLIPPTHREPSGSEARWPGKERTQPPPLCLRALIGSPGLSCPTFTPATSSLHAQPPVLQAPLQIRRRGKMTEKEKRKLNLNKRTMHACKSATCLCFLCSEVGVS